jgi:hypothetical protein
MEDAMSELSPEAASLIASERDAQNPSPADRARLRGKLTRELGAAAFLAGVAGVAMQPTAQAASVAKASALSLSAKLGLVGLCAAVIGGAAAFTLRGDQTKTTQRAHVAVRAPEVVQAPSVEAAAPPAPELEAAVTDAKPADRASKQPKPSAEPRSNTLGEEIALLSSSQQALRENRFADALTIVEKHETRHPNGALRIERMAVAAMAHCGLGEKDHPSIGALLDAAPNSPLSARVRSSCGVE